MSVGAISGGERVRRLSRPNGFSRPHDERFLSLRELARAVVGRAERSRTPVVETALIHREEGSSVFWEVAHSFATYRAAVISSCSGFCWVRPGKACPDPPSIPEPIAATRFHARATCATFTLRSALPAELPLPCLAMPNSGFIKYPFSAATKPAAAHPKLPRRWQPARFSSFRHLSFLALFRIGRSPTRKRRWDGTRANLRRLRGEFPPRIRVKPS